MNPGDTFFGFDKRGHLWIVLTEEDANGDVVVANFTTHDLARRTCSLDCLVVASGEHPFLRHESCIYLQGASLTSNPRLERGVTERVYHPQASLSAGLLSRIREGALASSNTPEPLKPAIRQSLGQS